jgi:uncharacterized protein (UPF0210 family)
MDLTRRDLVALLSAAALTPSPARAAAPSRARVRTVTAGVNLSGPDDRVPIERAFKFLETARAAFQNDGWTVQTVRIATQPLFTYAPNWWRGNDLRRLSALNELCTERGVALSFGPAKIDDFPDGSFAAKAADLVAAAPGASFSVFAASAERGVHANAARAAAEAILKLSQTTDKGGGNFNFAATALCPPGSPFFPAAYHEGEEAFAVGLESANIITDAAQGGATRIVAGLNEAAGGANAVALDIGAKNGRRYLGVDTSPAPGLDASIGAAIEAVSGVAFGDPGTLEACALITGILKALAVPTCGYSGLMLPVLEDRVLAKRAAEGRFTLSDLLLFSSVCGTGLDVAPLPGDVSVETMAALIRDMATLAVKLRKPLSARLFPTPGKKVGEIAAFNNPHMVDMPVMRPR